MLLLFLLFFGLREHKGKKFTPHSLRNLSWRKYWFLYFGSLWCSMNDERCTQYYPRLCEWSISVRNSIRANQHSFHVSLSLSSSLSLWVLFSVRVGPLFTRRIQPIEMSFFYLETALFPFKNGCFWADWRMRTLLLRTQLIFHEFVQTENFTILAIFFFSQTEISNDKIYNVDFGWVEWIGREQRNVQLDNIFMKNDLSNALFTSFFVCEHSQRYSADTCQTHTPIHQANRLSIGTTTYKHTCNAFMSQFRTEMIVCICVGVCFDIADLYFRRVVSFHAE